MTYNDKIKGKFQDEGLPKSRFRNCHCEQSEAISSRYRKIATNPSGPRNDSKDAPLASPYRDLGVVLVFVIFVSFPI